jgi:hypothetical protein
MSAKHFQKIDYADTTVVLRVHDPTKRRRTESAHEDTLKEIKRFPAHRVLLSAWSEKFDAQVNCYSVAAGLSPCVLIG